ncbi:PREDICTED: lysophospholipid acyltransferase 1 [Bactrocera latifrons]|uniref:Membrane-bound O-acyltransferase domain-containing protein 2 n=1 Tax=Bactrocera latifrons TaxID=174628 RepID=A0A0K8VHB0_BACLA|nr:PREDICTED: lysophospholipid acyltransferase 1 [Bactrocera latifrons]XP_018795847.1 PREDICTED: lysophospholipid acyltransferase 1 [Bactrocera latifrons]
MLESPKFVDNDNYQGSRAFTWLADICGLSVDLVNFLICQIGALFLASLFRSILHPSRVSAHVRHIFALTVGLAFGYFCFGPQAIHIAGLPSVCYIVIRTQDPRVVQRNVMLVAMTYLLCIHLIRQIYDYGSYSLDITGPLMIITQKVTSLAFSIHDGFVRQHKDLTKAQQYHAIYKVPSALEYFSYVLHFQGLLAGPLVFYKDYIEFVEGYNLLKRPSTNGNLDNGKSELVLEPSPVKAVIKKVIGSMVCAFIFMKFVKMYPVKNMKEDDFVNDSSMAYKFWYAMMATSCIRFKYYHAWLLADAICNNSGLGFTGYDKDGNSKWDLISNINVLGFEFATNMRDAINNWNCGTNRWLRTIVYERVPKKYGTVLTFALSAVWHGFYPGYYVTFATGALMVTAARVARRMFRHRFQRTQFTRMFYDILTCLTTRLVMGYATFPFVLLEFMGSIRLYLKYYLCFHIAALVTIFILPKYIRGEPRRERTPQKLQNPSEEDIKSNNFSTVSLPAASAAVQDVLNDISAKIPQGNSNDLNDDYENLSAPATTSNLNAPQPAPLLPTVACAREAVSVKHEECEMDQLGNKIKEKIGTETKNIEEFIDKTVAETVSGIVELKNDLMRNRDFPTIPISQDGLRKRVGIGANVTTGSGGSGNETIDKLVNGVEESGAFLKKEIEVINAVVQQANVLPAVLSNGHAK